MSDENTSENRSNESVPREKGIGALIQDKGLSAIGSHAELPDISIEYAPHKSQGLQSAADMWIDKERLFEGISKDEKTLEIVKKVTLR